MTRVVIVDDDCIVRQYLRMVLEDTHGEFEVVGEAANGEKGLQILTEVQPDMLILDMEMPAMGGAELLEKLEERQMKLQVLILSCHDEYDYVRQAMKLGAADYLLKHKEDDKALIAALRNLRDKEKKSEGVLQKKAVLGDLLSGTLTEEERKRTAEQFARPDQAVVVCAASIDYLRKYLWENGKEAAYRKEKQVWKSFQNTVVEGCKAFIHRIDMGIYGILLVFDHLSVSRMDSRWQLNRILTRYAKEVQEECEVSLTFGVSERMQGAEKGYRQWRNACSAMEQKLYCGCGRILFYEEMLVCRKEEPLQQQILDELRSKPVSEQECELAIQELFENLRMFPLFADGFTRLMYEMIDILMRMISRLNLQIRQVFVTVDFISELLMTHETLDDYSGWCLRVVHTMFEEAGKTSEKNRRNEVEKAISYVEKNYMKKISLDEVAEYVSVSKTYFCGLFKKEVGQSFSLYVLDYRLERACELLRMSDKEIYNIAYDTGFQSQNYFTNIFKKHYGMTPKEYRRQFSVKDRK